MGDDDNLNLLGKMPSIALDAFKQQISRNMGVPSEYLDDPVKPSSAPEFPQIGYKELERFGEQLQALCLPSKPDRMMVIDRDNPDPEQICELVNWYMKSYGKHLLRESAYIHYEITHDTDSPYAVAVANMNLDRPKTLDDVEITEEDRLDSQYLVRKWDAPTEHVDCVVLEFSDPVHRLAIVQYAHIMLGKGHHAIFDSLMKGVALYEALERSKIESMAKRLTQEGT